jgi:hypothetical protein
MGQGRSQPWSVAPESLSWHSNDLVKKAGVFVSGEHYQPNLVYVCEALAAVQFV